MPGVAFLEQFLASGLERSELIQAEDAGLVAYLEALAALINATGELSEFDRELIAAAFPRCAELAGQRTAFLIAGAREIAQDVEAVAESTTAPGLLAAFLKAQVPRLEELLSTARVAAAAMETSQAMTQHLHVTRDNRASEPREPLAGGARRARRTGFRRQPTVRCPRPVKLPPATAVTARGAWPNRRYPMDGKHPSGGVHDMADAIGLLASRSSDLLAHVLTEGEIDDESRSALARLYRMLSQVAAMTEEVA